MNHLTRQQILATVDNELGKTDQERLQLHLNDCARCRNEVAVQRALTSVARESLQTRASVRFTERVMSKVLRTAKYSSFTYKILQNLGYVFAMMLVVGVLGTVLMNPSRFLSGQSPSQPSEFLTKWNTVSGQINQFFQQSTSQLNQTLAQRTSPPSWKIILMTLCILGVYAVVDRYVIQRVVRMKM
jgi:hypothetical protein